MKVLIVGGGGREHALAWKAAQSPRVERVYVAPGNAGTAREAGVENVPIDAGDVSALLDFARERDVGLTIVGPEGPLVAGIVDLFQADGLACFGPGQAAARLEGSKTFSKEFLTRHGIPTASWGSFTEVDAALAFIEKHGAPIVVKADGLAAGKGVIIARSEAEAGDAVREILAGNAFGAAGSRVVIEEFLQGEEASFIVICDGRNALPLASSQDHKARNEGDTGPNTGGMGAYSPAPVISETLHARVMAEVIEPTLRGMAEEGNPYTGFLYAGLMITPDGSPRVLEFNCRCGDPETQPIMMRLRSDLVELCAAALTGGVAGIHAEWDHRTALGVVLAADAYPSGSSKGRPIAGLDGLDGGDLKVFHAGTREEDGRVVTHGGRVLCVCALGDDIAAARQRAYQGVAAIHWDGIYYRGDIGYRAMARKKCP